MKVFVTGGTGFLGNTLIHLLVDQGHEVVALARHPAKAAPLFTGKAVTLVEGDMENVAGFATHLAGCEGVFHCAAYWTEYNVVGDHWQKLETVNVKGTVHLLEAAQKHGVGKVIYASSAGVIGHGVKGSPVDENSPPGWYSNKNLYFKSKLLAERAIDDFLSQNNLSVVFILPAVIFGPGDLIPTNNGKIIIQFMQKKLSGMPKGGLSFVDVRDVAETMLKAMDKGKSGERYLVSGHYLSTGEILNALKEATGVTRGVPILPFSVLRPIGALTEIGGKLTGRRVAFSVDDARYVYTRINWSSEKAKRELGATFRPYATTFADAAAWFKANGYV